MREKEQEKNMEGHKGMTAEMEVKRETLGLGLGMSGVTRMF